MKKLNILVLENNNEFLLSMKYILNSTFKVNLSSDIQDAIKKISNSKNKIDLIVTNILIKDINIHEFITEIQKLNHSIPVILITAYDYDYLLKDFLNINNIYYLVKPFDKYSLIEKIKNISTKFNKCKGGQF